MLPAQHSKAANVFPYFDGLVLLRDGKGHLHVLLASQEHHFCVGVIQHYITNDTSIRETDYIETICLQRLDQTRAEVQHSKSSRSTAHERHGPQN